MDWSNGYYHCHLTVDGVRTDVVATYCPNVGVFLEPAHRRDRMPYYVSSLTPRRQKKLRGKISWVLGSLGEDKTLREPNPDYSFVFVVPVERGIEEEYGAIRSRYRKGTSREDPGRDIVSKAIIDCTPTLLRTVSGFRGSEQDY